MTTPTPKNKGGRKPGPQWTPALRLFVELMKKGETQTAAAKQAWPKNKRPDVQAARAKRSPLVQAEMEQYQRVRQEEELARAKMAGRMAGIVDAMSKNEKLKLLAEIGRNKGGGHKDVDRIRAIYVSAKLQCEIINVRLELSEIDALTEEQQLFYAQWGYLYESLSAEQKAFYDEHGYIPAEPGTEKPPEPGAAPPESGSPPAGRVN